ncbi:MAG: ABC transporter ATP-binding protein, partial [Bacteroidota bacterium]|nr:ABC transporter ATP-binding protein [Bacteroidota bacterium]
GLKIVKGDFVIIKGESGVGKTTLIKLLMGLLKPDKGVIYVDNDNLGLIDKSSWFNTLSYVPQKPTIIEGDLMDNICLGIDKSKVDTELYNSVLRQSQLTKLNNSLNGKIIMSDGSSISGGQKQRIAIARAIYRKSNIIFLDEPTSSLDQKNKDSIIELLDDINKSNETTVIIITHSDHFDGYSTNEIRL